MTKISCLLDNQFIGTKGEYGEHLSYFKYERYRFVFTFFII